jgi:hypothetical protein
LNQINYLLAGTFLVGRSINIVPEGNFFEMGRRRRRRKKRRFVVPGPKY